MYVMKCFFTRLSSYLSSTTTSSHLLLASNNRSSFFYLSFPTHFHLHPHPLLILNTYNSNSTTSSSSSCFRCSEFEQLTATAGVRCYSSSSSSSSSAKKGRRKKKEQQQVTTTTLMMMEKKKDKEDKEELEMEMEKEKDAFFVVRKGDVVGIYKTLSACQHQLGSSVCDPPVSVYKGYSLPNHTQQYLLSHGLKDALYTISATDFKDDLFDRLQPCPFQDPYSTEGGNSNEDVSKKRSLGVLEQDDVKVTSLTSISEDPLRKQVKLDRAALIEASSHETRTCLVEFDGASKGNPGKAGAGAILRASDGSLICRLREGVGIATNNAAEYRAMILGMRCALQKGFNDIRIQGDSKLVCKQIDGSWKVKNENLSTLYNVAKELKDKFLSFQISHVLRNFNSEADAQANLAISLADGQVQEECVD